MAKLVLQPNPRFKGKVAIPCTEEEPATVELIFKHRTRSAFVEFWHTRTGESDLDIVMDIVSGWDLEEEFNHDNVGKMLENYFCAAETIVNAYGDLLKEGKTKN